MTQRERDIDAAVKQFPCILLEAKDSYRESDFIPEWYFAVDQELVAHIRAAYARIVSAGEIVER